MNYNILDVYTSICYICIYIHTSSQCTHTPQCGE